MLTNSIGSWMAATGGTTASERVRMRPKPFLTRLLSATAVAVLVASGLVTGPAPVAFAETDEAASSAVADQPATEAAPEEEEPSAPAETAARDGVVALTQTVGTGGTSALTDFGEVVSFETLVSLSTGHTLTEGGVTTVTLDESLKLANYGALPSGAQSQSWDEQTNTLTVTWRQLLSGGFYGVTVNAVPSAMATDLSEFRATAVTRGVGSDGSGGAPELTQSATSASLRASENAFPAEISEVQPGDWKLPMLSARLYPGGSTTQYPFFSQEAGVNPVAFNNLQVVTRWNEVGVDGDALLPKAWVTRNEIGSMAEATVTMQRLRDDTEETRNSVGSQGGPLIIRGRENITLRAAADAAPGTYSVLRTLEDTRADGSTVVISSSALRVIVAEDAATTVSFSGNRVPAEVAAGEPFEWGGALNVPEPPRPIKDVTVTLPIPTGMTPTAFAARQYVAVATKSVEYTTESPLTDESDWQALPLSQGTSGNITEANAADITGIRFVLNDISASSSSSFSYFALTLRPDADLAGDTVDMRASSVTYEDPVAGPTTLTPGVGWGATTKVSDAASVEIALENTGVGYAGLSFDQTLANGSSFDSRLFLGSAGTAAVAKPYMFVVVPKGMGVSNLTGQASLCQPAAWPYTSGGCIYGVPVLDPAPTVEGGSVQLSDGSTLHYVQDTSSELRRGGLAKVAQLYSQPRFTLQSVLSGEQKILIGGGSADAGDFDVASTLSSHTAYGKQPLNAASSYGAYAGRAGEIQQALADIGINVQGQAMIGERGITVSPATTVGSAITVTGEDGKPVSPGTGAIAEAKPGGTVGYQVDVSNTGSVVYKNFQFIDVLPYVGDTYTLNEGTSRGSQFATVLSDNVKVLVNGAPSPGVTLEYSISETPDRFDKDGADVAGDAGWRPYTGAVNGAKALRVTLAGGVAFTPGDTITLSFDATIPASAPRGGELANNSIPYRFETPNGEWIASEAPFVSVKSTAPSGDVELSGQAFLDLNNNGTQDAGEDGVNGSGISLQLYKQRKNGTFAPTGSAVVPNLNDGIDGVFPFVALDEGTYKIKPLSSSKNITFHASALDRDGFLTYTGVADAAANAPADTSSYVGETEFTVGTSAGVVSEWIRDLRLPVLAVTDVTGAVELVDASGTPMPAADELCPYLSDYSVRLEGEGVDETVSASSTGAFSFEGLKGVLPGNYTLTFAAGETSAGLIASSLNNDAVFADGVYTLASLQPGIGATGVRVYYTDGTKPIVKKPVLAGEVEWEGVPFNPTGVSAKTSDAETSVKSQAWDIRDAEGGTVANGSALGANSVMPLPLDVADGRYTLVVTSTDLIGNVSEASRPVSFAVDRSAPELKSDTTEFTAEKDSPAAPATPGQWIELFAVSAVDAGVGMPITGGISVDASDVKTSPGSYDVVFTATDAIGNTTVGAQQLTLTYTVAYAGDPVILLQSNSAQFEMGTPAPTDDASWEKLFGGLDVQLGHSSVTERERVVDVSAVDLTVPGDYSVIFTVTDSLGAVGATTGTVRVQDTTAPIVTPDAKTVVFADGETKLAADDADAWIELFGVAATDEGGTGVVSLEVDASRVDYATAGSYPVVFTAKDRAGNAASVMLTYSVEFAGSPVVNVGAGDARYEMGDARPATDAEWISLFEVSAATAPGTTLKSLSVNSSAVQFDTLNAVTGYTVTFTATDNHGNVGVAAAQLFVVDTVKPSLTLGQTEVIHAMEAPDTPWTAAQWAEAFAAKAEDPNGSGIDTASWRVTEGVDFTVAGSYTISITVADRAGNESEAAEGTLVVQAPPTSSVQDEVRIAQQSEVLLDPLSVTTSTGELEALTTENLGSASAGGSLTIVNDKVVYTPADGYAGAESFSITVQDTLGQTGAVEYNFMVVGAPVLTGAATLEFSVPVDGSLTIPNLTSPALVSGEHLTLVSVQKERGFVGTLDIAKNGTDIVFETDKTDWSGTNTAQITVKDDVGQTVVITAQIEVVSPKFTVDAATGFAGKSELGFSASGLVPGASYSIELRSKPLALGTFTAAADGTGQLRATVPSGAALGVHELVLLNADAQPRASLEFTVLDAATTGGNGTGPGTSNDGLSATGAAGFAVLSAAGALLLGGGLVALLRARRLRSVTAANNGGEGHSGA